MLNFIKILKIIKYILKCKILNQLKQNTLIVKFN